MFRHCERSEAIPETLRLLRFARNDILYLADIRPHLLSDIDVVEVDSEGNLAIVDETALLTALREGWIAGAGLDTVATEPLPPESPLWSLPNAFITPHCSALSPPLRERIAQLFIDNLKRYQTGQPLRNVVDKKAGY
jgi:hypothetical protein